MARRISFALAFIALLPPLVTSAGAQSLEQRIDHVRQQRAAERPAQNQPRADATRAQPVRRDLRARFYQILDDVQLDGVEARRAFDWWARRTDIPLVINWRAFETAGIDPRRPITLKLRAVPAGHLLRILMKQTAPNVELIHQLTPWYVKVMTKREANRQRVVRIYDVGDLVMPVPQFTDAPDFDLRSAIGGDGGNNGGGGQSASLFTDDADGRDEDDTPTRQQRGEDLASLIRDVVEPSVWQANGGESSVRYFDNRLIVRAPLYVHQQIGMPTVTPDRARHTARASRAAKAHDQTNATPARVDRRRTTNTGGIGPASAPTSGVVR